jgi:uncharacterized OB-fold protein
VTAERASTAQRTLPTGPDETYRRRLAEGRLAYQRCDDCSAAASYARVVCPSCGGRSLTWRESAGLGTVYAASTVHARGEDPYDVALVDLDEGFRIMTRVDGVPPDDVRIDMRVTLRVVEAADGSGRVPVFEPIAEGTR